MVMMMVMVLLMVMVLVMVMVKLWVVVIKVMQHLGPYRGPKCCIRCSSYLQTAASAR